MKNSLFTPFSIGFLVLISFISSLRAQMPGTGYGTNNPPTAPRNLPPVVSITQPLEGAVFQKPTNILIHANVSDPDNAVIRVQFFAGTNLLGVIGRTNNSSSFTWIDPRPGRHVLTAKAYDALLASTVSAPVTIDVIEATPLPQTNLPAVVTIVATDSEGEEIPPVPPGMGMPQRYNPAVFTVSRTGATDFAMDVFYQIGGRASNGVDYAKLSGTVTIPLGAKTAEIIVSPIYDKDIEGTETVILTVLPPICPAIYPPPPSCYKVGIPSDATAYILDSASATNKPPSVSMVSPLDGEVFTNTASIHLLAQAQDLDGWVATVEFFDLTNSLGIITNNPLVMTFMNPFQIFWTNAAVGRHTLFAVATDNSGASAVSAPVNIAVFETNQAPFVRITQPINGTLFKAPAQINILADARAATGMVSTLEFFQGTNSLGVVTNIPDRVTAYYPFNLTWSNVPAGMYYLTAVATDNAGVTAQSLPVMVQVVEWTTNVIPVVTIAATDPYASEGSILPGWPGCTIQTNIIGANPTSGGIRFTNMPAGYTNTGTFTVYRTGNTAAALEVAYTIGGTASNGVDYVTLPGSVTIPSGKASAKITIIPIEDTLFEARETVQLTLVAPVVQMNTAAIMNSTSSLVDQTLPPYLIGSANRATVVIEDNDGPRPPIRLPDGQYHFWQPATNGTSFVIQSSTDLMQWTTLITNTVTKGVIEFVDPEAVNLKRSFYRAIPVAQ